MGSFNVSCFVSGLTIAPGDACVMLPLKRAKYFFEEFGSEFNQPFMAYPAIRGVYDDYGRIRDIAPSAYHDHWELGQQFRAYIVDDGETNALKGFTYAWVRGEIWDGLTKPLTMEGRKPGAYEQADLSAEVLKLLGFVEDGETPDERYKRRFIYPSEPNLCIGSDGTWIRLFDRGTIINEHLYHPDQLVEFWPQPLDTTAIKATTAIRLIVEKGIANHNLEHERDLEMIGLFEREDPAYAEKLKDQVPGGFALWNLESRWGMEGVLSPVSDHLSECVDELIDLLQFRRNLSMCSIMIKPSMNGPQCGDLDASLDLATLIYETAKRDKAEHDLEMGDDDE